MGHILGIIWALFAPSYCFCSPQMCCECDYSTDYNFIGCTRMIMWSAMWHVSIFLIVPKMAKSAIFGYIRKGLLDAKGNFWRPAGTNITRLCRNIFNVAKQTMTVFLSITLWECCENNGWISKNNGQLFLALQNRIMGGILSIIYLSLMAAKLT